MVETYINHSDAVLATQCPFSFIPLLCFPERVFATECLYRRIMLLTLMLYG